MHVPKALIGTSHFATFNSTLCVLTIRSAQTFSIALMREPVTTALGVFRMGHLLSATRSRVTQLPESRLVSLLCGAFDSGSVSVSGFFEDQDEELVAAMGIHDGGSGIHAATTATDAGEEEQKEKVVPSVKITMPVNGVDQVLNLQLRPVAAASKDALVWVRGRQILSL